MKRIGLLACAGVLAYVGIAHAQNEASATKTFRVKHVRSGVVAWWLDPLHNEEPIEVKASRNAGAWAGEKNVDPRRASMEDNPYDTRYSLWMKANAENEKPIVPREAPAGSTPEMFALPAGVTQVFNLDTQNALLAYGTPAGLEELQKTIALLDQPIRQIEIEAKYVSLTDAAQKSLQALFPDKESSAPTAMRAFTNLDTAAVEARLNELIAKDQARIINAPRVTTLNNLTARLGSTMERPGVIGYKDDKGQFQSVFDNGKTPEQGKLYVGVAMNFIITPTVHRDDTITIKVQPTKTLIMSVQHNEPAALPRREPIPLRVLDSVVALANVRDGTTMALTGLDTSFFDPTFWSAPDTKQKNPQPNMMLFVKASLIRRNDERVASHPQG